MRIRTGKGKHTRRAMLAGLLLAMLVLSQSVFAASGAVREVHKVPAGEKMYCFFVAHNVVLTPAEIAAIGDDEALTMEVLKRAGLTMSESSCKEHPAITMEAWLAAGNTLQLSDIDIIKLRQAVPTDGEPVKLHLDLRFSVKEEDEESLPPEPEEPADPPAEDPGDTPADTPDGPAAGTPDETQPAATDEEGEPASDPPAATEPEDPDTAQQTDPGNTPETDPGNTPETDPGDTPAETPEEEPAEPVITRTYHSTFKKTSPELLFIVIATEADAATAEDTCGPDEEAPAVPVPSEAELPEIPELPEMDMDLDMLEGAAEPQTMLPEYRKIEMKDKSGAPIEEALQDGEPVSLEWIEPKKTIDKSDFDKFLEKFPGGGAGLGALAGIAAAGAAAIVVVRRKRDAAD